MRQADMAGWVLGQVGRGFGAALRATQPLMVGVSDE